MAQVILSPQKTSPAVVVHSLGEAFLKMNSQAKDKVAPTSLLLLKCVMGLRPTAGPELGGQGDRTCPLIPSHLLPGVPSSTVSQQRN